MLFDHFPKCALWSWYFHRYYVKENFHKISFGNFGLKHTSLLYAVSECNCLLSSLTSKGIDHFPFSCSGYGAFCWGGTVSQSLVLSRTHWKMFYISSIDLLFFLLLICMSFLKMEIMSYSFLFCWSWVQVPVCRRFQYYFPVSFVVIKCENINFTIVAIFKCTVQGY